MKVSFDVPNSLASVLGFNKRIYGVGCHASRQLVNIMSVNFILVHCNIIRFRTCCSWTKDTRSATQFNLPPSDCRRHFNFVSVVNGRRRRALGFTWREIDYTFSSS